MSEGASPTDLGATFFRRLTVFFFAIRRLDHGTKQGKETTEKGKGTRENASSGGIILRFRGRLTWLHDCFAG